MLPFLLHLTRSSLPVSFALFPNTAIVFRAYTCWFCHVLGFGNDPVLRGLVCLFIRNQPPLALLRLCLILIIDLVVVPCDQSLYYCLHSTLSNSLVILGLGSYLFSLELPSCLGFNLPADISC